MRSELLNLWLFISAIAKVLLMTGLGMGGVVALFAECCGFRVVALGKSLCAASLRAAENRESRLGLREVKGILALWAVAGKTGAEFSTPPSLSENCEADPTVGIQSGPHRASFRAGQLAKTGILIPVNLNPATSPARKARRYA